jgi:hypothetical protein
LSYLNLTLKFWPLSLHPGSAPCFCPRLFIDLQAIVANRKSSRLTALTPSSQETFQSDSHRSYKNIALNILGRLWHIALSGIYYENPTKNPGVSREIVSQDNYHVIPMDALVLGGRIMLSPRANWLLDAGASISIALNGR